MEVPILVAETKYQAAMPARITGIILNDLSPDERTRAIIAAPPAIGLAYTFFMFVARFGCWRYSWLPARWLLPICRPS